MASQNWPTLLNEQSLLTTNLSERTFKDLVRILDSGRFGFFENFELNFSIMRSSYRDSQFESTLSLCLKFKPKFNKIKVGPAKMLVESTMLSFKFRIFEKKSTFSSLNNADEFAMRQTSLAYSQNVAHRTLLISISNPN